MYAYKKRLANTIRNHSAHLVGSASSLLSSLWSRYKRWCAIKSIHLRIWFDSLWLDYVHHRMARPNSPSAQIPAKTGFFIHSISAGYVSLLQLLYDFLYSRLRRNARLPRFAAYTTLFAVLASDSSALASNDGSTGIWDFNVQLVVGGTAISIAVITAISQVILSKKSKPSIDKINNLESRLELVLEGEKRCKEELAECKKREAYNMLRVDELKRDYEKLSRAIADLGK